MFIKFRFILVDIGDSGLHSGGGLLSNSDFGQALLNHSLFIPDPCPLTRPHNQASLCDCCR